MPLPGDITTITVTGYYVDMLGNPLEGQVAFAPTSQLSDSTGQAVIGGDALTAPLVGGRFSVVLPCTDNATLNPMGFAYTVTEQVGKGRSTYAVQLPHALGSTVDITALAPVNPPTPYSTVYGIKAGTNVWSGSNTFAVSPTGPDPTGGGQLATKAYVDAHGGVAPVWHTGSDVPASGLGVNGDMYLRTVTGDVYEKAAGSWGSPAATILGPAGAAGAAGATGATGATGPAGPGVAAGGTAGQFLKKTSSVDFATAFAGIVAADVSGLGGAAALNVGTSAGTVAAGNDSRLAPPWRFNVQTYGATGDGTTDDTAAIQAAVNAAFAYANAHSFYAEVYFPVPALWYAINGPLVKGGTTLGCAQITLPIQPVTSNKITLAFLGQADVSATLHWQQTTRQITGVTLKSNSDTAIDNTNGEASIIGGPTPQHGYGTSGTLFSNMLVYWDGIQLMGPNAVNGIGGLDLRGVAACGGGSYAYMVDAHPVGAPGIAGGSISGNYFGLATPNNGNNDVSYWQSVTVYGMTYGVILGEHTHISALRAVYCFDAIVVVGTFYSGPGALHGVTIGNASVESVTIGGSHLILVGQGAKCHIYLDVEDTTVTIADQGSGTPGTGDVWLTGGWTTLNLPGSTSNLTVHNTIRAPGHVAAPSVPASAAALQNTFGRAAAVTVTGGTVTVIAVDGTAVGSTSGTVMVPAGKNIALTYSVAPTWVWTLL